MEKRSLMAYSVDERLITGMKFYGRIGNLLGVIQNNDNYYAIIEDENGKMYAKNCAIDAIATMTKKGPSVTEHIYFGENNLPISFEQLDYIKKGYDKFKNLDFLYGGEVNIELGLEQQGNTVFVGDDEVIEYFHNLKKLNPSVPLTKLTEDQPFLQKENGSQR